MFKENRNNIINVYTETIIDDYYNNQYISNEKKMYLKKCLTGLKRSTMFLHVTPKLNKILQSKSMLCSSGGLGGVVYAVPVDDDYRIHNLGEYIINKELPMFLRNNNDDSRINSLLIVPSNNKIGYVDYLEFGKWYYHIYNDNNYLIDNKLLDKYVNKTLKESKEIITLSNDIKNIEKIFEIMSGSNVLKIYLFESVLEYLFLFQKNTTYESMNNQIVKDIIYKLCPELGIKFALSNFNVSFKKFYKIIINSNMYDEKIMNEYLNSRIVFFIERYILKNPENMYGHIIFRNFNIRKELEIEFSKMLWSEAKKGKYNILTYIIPKGEVGVLPFGTHKIYKCFIKNNYCFPKEQFNVKIIESLYTQGIMRNPYNKEDENMELPIKVQGVMYSKNNNKIEYLIIKRCESDGGFWQGVTGTLEEGEKLKECLIREIKEELGITDIKNISDLKQTLQWAKKTGFMITEYVYAVEFDRNVKVTLSEEHDDYRWCSFEDAYKTLGKDNNKNTLKMIDEELTNE